MKKRVKKIEVKEEKFDFKNLKYFFVSLLFSLIFFNLVVPSNKLSFIGVIFFSGVGGILGFIALVYIWCFFTEKKIVWKTLEVRGI